MCSPNQDVTILLAEDDDSQFAVMRGAFERAGLGGKSLKRLREPDELFAALAADPAGRQIVLMDLPNGDGARWLGALGKLKADPGLRRVPAIILMEPDGEKVARAYDLGASSIIRKPVGFFRLIDLFTMLRRYWSEFAV